MYLRACAHRSAFSPGPVMPQADQRCRVAARRWLLSKSVRNGFVEWQPRFQEAIATSEKEPSAAHITESKSIRRRQVGAPNRALFGQPDPRWFHTSY
jgi:hypothetical protein